jgi:hypothetical protein
VEVAWIGFARQIREDIMFRRFSIACAITIAMAFFVMTLWKKEHPAVPHKAEETIPSEAEIEGYSLEELRAADQQLDRYYSQKGVLRKFSEGNTEEMYRLLAAKTHIQQRIEDLKMDN